MFLYYRKSIGLDYDFNNEEKMRKKEKESIKINLFSLWRRPQNGQRARAFVVIWIVDRRINVANEKCQSNNERIISFFCCRFTKKKLMKAKKKRRNEENDKRCSIGKPRHSIKVDIGFKMSDFVIHTYIPKEAQKTNDNENQSIILTRLAKAS